MARLSESRYADARTKAEEALELYRQMHDSGGEAQALMALAAIENRQHTTPEVFDLYRQSLAIYRRLEDRLGTWQVLYGLAEAHRFQGHNVAALQAIADAKTVLGKLADHGIPFDLRSFGLAGLFQGISLADIETLPGLLPEEFDLRQLVVAELTAMTLISEALVLRQEARYEEALAVLDQALTPARSMPVKVFESQVLGLMGEIEGARGNVDRALEILEQARQSARSLFDDVTTSLEMLGMPGVGSGFGPLRVPEASVLQTLATIQVGQGRFENALDAYREALAIARSADKKELQAQVVTQLGTLYQLWGRYGRARGHFEHGLRMAREVGARDAEAGALWYLGELDNLEGRHQEALRHHEQSLQIAHQIGRRAWEGRSLFHLGSTCIQLNLVDEATSYLSKALEIAAEIGNHDLEYGVLMATASLYAKTARYEEALQRCEQALALARSLGQSQGEIESLNALGVILHRASRDEEAVLYLEEAAELARTNDHPLGESAARLALGLAYSRLKLDRRAEEALESSLVISRRLGSESLEIQVLAGLGIFYRRQGADAAAVGPLEQAAAILGLHQDRIQVQDLATAFDALLPSAIQAGLVDLHASLGDIDQAFLHSERSRAHTFLRLLGSSWRSDETSDAANVAAEREALSRLEDQIERSLAKEPAAARSPVVVRLRRELEEAREHYQKTLRDLRLSRPEDAALLDADVMPLDRVRREISDPESALVAFYVLDERVLAWVVDRDQARMISLGIDRGRLEQLVSEFEDRLLGRDSDRRIAARLHVELIAPLESELHHRRLILVPHDVLHRLSFAALWNPHRRRYLIEDYAISYVPSASVLRFLAGKRSSNEGRLLVLGDPDGSLPGADAEASAIARLYGTEAYLGPDATEARVWAAAGNVDVLHLAAHAAFDVHQPRFSRVELAPGGGRDGHLEVHEIFGGLDLRGVDLVVLSACETARGERTRGDEVVGLTRALMYAGCPAVVTTLWKIDDAASGLLMETFHRRLRAGEDADEALRHAQLVVHQKPETSDPYYWAAFALHGDGRSVGGPTNP